MRSDGQKELCKVIAVADEWEKIPLLEDCLNKIPSSVDFIIEFKMDSEELIDKVHDLLKKHHRSDGVFWFSLIESINKKLRGKDKSIPTITSIAGMLKVLFLYYTGLLAFFPLDDAVFGITVEEVGTIFHSFYCFLNFYTSTAVKITLEKIRHEKALKGMPDWFHSGLSYLFQGRPPRPMLAPALFSHLRKRGMPVWFLGVNSEEDLKLASDAGATGFLTDR